MAAIAFPLPMPSDLVPLPSQPPDAEFPTADRRRSVGHHHRPAPGEALGPELGLLYLRDGVWDGRRVLPVGWVDDPGDRPPGQDLVRERR